MAVEAIAALQIFTSLFDNAKGLVEIRDAATRDGAVLMIQKQVLEAQAAQLALVKRVGELEQEIVGLKDWEAEKQRYELKAIDRGAFAYMPKAGVEDEEPPHWLCANCFNKRQKSFLQFKGQDRSATGGRGTTATYGCDGCRATVTVYYTRNPLTPWAHDSAEQA
ncbi:hypothetical protein [Devosia aquimaris]|uniref:hypothetical protein n=1 Tax=Devosia aquimaris TaxID=2866214 RepID=UPI001CD06B4B|nr:hypothetical protein [Devosia sp. CJK-A8-3]